MPAEFLHGVEVIEIQGGTRPLRTAKSSVIGLVGTSETGPANTPTLVSGPKEAAQFGINGTLPAALEAIFAQAGASVVVVSVQPGSDSKTTVTGQLHTFEGDILKLPHQGVTEVVVKENKDSSPKTYAANTDYKVDLSKGVITRLGASETAPAAGASVKVTYKHPKLSAVTPAHIKGAVDSSTGAYSGAQALLDAEALLGLVPRILIAPGFTGPASGTNKSAAAGGLEALAERLRAIVIVDGPSTKDADAITYRAHFGSRRVYLVDPKVKVPGQTAAQPASSYVAGLIARSDADRGFWWSPSNQPIFGISGTERPIDFTLGDANSRANTLNAKEVATVIRRNGYRLWGNRTCSSDPKWAFLSVVRTADMIHDALLRSHLWAVDRSITKTYIEDVADGVNAYLRELVGLGAILGGKCWVDPELNSKAVLQSGKIYFDFDFTPPTPAEHVTFRSRLVKDYLKEIL